MCTDGKFFFVARSTPMGHSSKRTLKHGLGICEFSTKSSLGVVSFLRSPFGGRRTIPGHEGLSASLVFESPICLMGFRATGIFARRRAVMAPRECAHAVCRNIFNVPVFSRENHKL